MQALQWCKLMKDSGNEVIELSEWGDYDWKSFDVIHFFYFGLSYFLLYDEIKKRAVNAKFVCSPILDPHYPIFVYKFLSKIIFKKAKIFSEYSALRCFEDRFDVFLVRTEYEKKFLSKAFGISLNKIKTIHLSSRFASGDNQNYLSKEQICLHVSRICDPTKNVERLVKAALKYNIHLVLAGASTNQFDMKLKKMIGNNSKIEILGKVSDDMLIELYKKAKVFALPSIREGVGYAALEAASFSCDIVITNIGGPKEYFLPNAIAVNPFDIDDIGSAINSFLKGLSFQPNLNNSIIEKFSEEKIRKDLMDVYQG